MSRAGQLFGIDPRSLTALRIGLATLEDAAARVYLCCQVGRFGFAPDSPGESLVMTIVSDAVAKAGSTIVTLLPFAGDASAPPTAVPFVPVDLARVDHVTYEIQLRDNSGVGYPRLVYRRRGLAEPRHTIE